MPFDSDFHSRQLQVINPDGDFNETDLRIGAYIMIPIGLFLVFQAYPRMKITHVVMAFFMAAGFFGSQISSKNDISTIGIGVAKVLGAGTALAAGALYFDWIGFTILGLFTGMLSPICLLLLFGNGLTNKDQRAFIDSFQTLIGFLVLGGLIIPCILQKKIVIPFSVMFGVSLLTFAGSVLILGENFFTMNQYKWPFLIFQIAFASLGFAVQSYFKKKEEKVQEELVRQKNEEIAKSTEAINSYYQNANAINQRGVPVPIYGQPMPMPMPVNMGYPPAMQRSVYQAPPVYSQMNVSGGQQRGVDNPASPPPKNENISIQQIQANLSNIPIKTNKQYEF